MMTHQNQRTELDNDRKAYEYTETNCHVKVRIKWAKGLLGGKIERVVMGWMISLGLHCTSAERIGRRGGVVWGNGIWKGWSLSQHRDQTPVLTYATAALISYSLGHER